VRQASLYILIIEAFSIPVSPLAYENPSAQHQVWCQVLCGSLGQKWLILMDGIWMETLPALGGQGKQTGSCCEDKSKH